MNESSFQSTPHKPIINLEPWETEDIKDLRSRCDKELNRRHKIEVRKFKAEFKRKAEKYGLSVTVENKD